MVFRRIGEGILAFLFLFALCVPLSAAAQTTVEVFSREGCSHCADFFDYTNTLATSRTDFVVVVHDIGIPKERELFDAITSIAHLSKVTPITYIAGEFVVGFNTPETTGKIIESLLDKAEGNSYPTLADYASGEGTIAGSASACPEETCVESPAQTVVGIPFTDRTISVGAYSLPVVSFVLGLIDGFNPCAMWVLVMFVTALAAIGNKKRMRQVVLLFLIAEAVMYHAILSAWLFAWDFIGLDHIITPIVGAVAIVAGLYFLRQYDKRDASCALESPERRRSIGNKVRSIATQPMTIATVVGILGLAFSVNIFEFACSIGIPQTFTKLLDVRADSWLVREFNTLIYIGGYMVDDFVVFGLALYSFDKIGITARYARIAHLIGGVLMLVLGLIMLLAPSVLAG